MVKSINLLLILSLFFGIVLLTLQRGEDSNFALKRTEEIFQISYNSISIKQIDSLTSNTNLKFSEIIAERIKIK